MKTPFDVEIKKFERAIEALKAAESAINDVGYGINEDVVESLQSTFVKRLNGLKASAFDYITRNQEADPYPSAKSS